MKGEMNARKMKRDVEGGVESGVSVIGETEEIDGVSEWKEISTLFFDL